SYYSTDEVFRVQEGMAIPKGQRFNYEGTIYTYVGGDGHVGSGQLITGETGIGVEYDPATYYTVISSGNYTVKDGSGTNVSGDCASPSPTNYGYFEDRPSEFKAQGNNPAVALAPDGRCLEAHTIAANTDEMQNFANWFSYYRKRHLATRGGLTSALNDITGIRVGMFTINDLGAVTMRDFDTEKDTVFGQIYSEEVDGGTPNRQALYHAGNQYDTNTNIVTDECQKNFTLMFTDGFASLGGTLPSPGDADGDDGSPYADSYSNTLADIAMYYYENTLRGDSFTAGEVPVSDQCDVSPVDPKLDCNDDLHMVTYTVGLGAQGTIFNNPAVSPFYDEVADVYSTAVTWPDVNTARDPRQIDDLYHAAVNGRGEMYNAATPADLADELETALKSITSQTGSASAVAFNTSVLSTGSVVYQARFNTDKWRGQLLSFDLDAGTGAVSATANWDAGNLLPAADSRVILTYNPDASYNRGVTFTANTNDDLSDSSLSAAAIADLSASLPGDRDAEDRLDYVRGDRSDEGEGFRVRHDDTVLGDIVHSAPVFVGAPSQGWPDGNDANGFPQSASSYSAFQDATTRTSVVYIGANDGMLHGFNASTGVEVLGYIPNAVYSSSANEGLHYLSDPDYQHRYYVDGTPTISDAYTPGRNGDGTTSSTAWRTVLVGSLRGGGQGVYALDVTSPDSFSSTDASAASTVLWEFTSADDPDLGDTFSRPTIVPTNATDGSGNLRWAAILGNGYNSGSNTPTAGDCSAKLFILFLDGGLDGEWTLGTDYLKIGTGAGSADDCNGLSTPRVVDIDSNAIADLVYAGDLHGNLWAFDLCNVDNQGVCQGSGWGVKYDDGANPTPAIAPLFTAKDASGNRQPITVAPTVISHPTIFSTGFDPNVLVLFGTGQYIVDGDKSNPVSASNPRNTYYGVWDRGDAQLLRAKLMQQVFETGYGAGASIRVTGTDEPDYTAPNAGDREYGWYLDLPDTSAADNSASGAPERVVVNSVVVGDIVFFNTLVPTANGCDVGGYGYLMSVLTKNGGRPDDSVFDANNDGSINDSDLVTVGDDNVAAVGQVFEEGIVSEPSFLSDNRYVSTSKGDIEQDETEPPGTAEIGRYSWQEIRDE
ncbi:MAG: PilC/PilY family type IV pilus protein, partial [Granulosicoccaceae bacterium]